jgi:hypothetical protein
MGHPTWQWPNPYGSVDFGWDQYCTHSLAKDGPHGWAEGCSLWPFPVPHRSARDGPYRYHTGGPKAAPYYHSLCHTVQPEMGLHPHISHYLRDFSEASNQCYNEINWLTSNTQSISSWASVSIGQSANLILTLVISSSQRYNIHSFIFHSSILILAK